jgi:hypothetical protein
MKKSVIIVAIFSLILLSLACQKDELQINQSSNELTEDLRVYIQGQDLKSTIEVSMGDTIQLLDDTYYVLYVEDVNNQPVKCFWSISTTNMIGEEELSTYYGDQISHKFEELGYHELIVSLTPNHELSLFVSFYVFIDNQLPGKLGDGPENNYIFRLEKKKYGTDRYWFAYFKYQDQSVDVKQAELISYDVNGNVISGQTIALNPWIHNNYYYFFMEDSEAAFFRLTYLTGGLMDENNYLSSWFDGEGIKFSISLSPPEPGEFVCGDNVTFNYGGEIVTYGSVLGGAGKCWLDRNLGASRVCLSMYDSLCFGDFIQWGRLIDGHQELNSGLSFNQSPGDMPGHDLFIAGVNGSGPYDWRSPHNNALWQGVDGANNPCPPGWRLPTIPEISEESWTWEPGNGYPGAITNESAFWSILKVPSAGHRKITGEYSVTTPMANFWSSTTMYSFGRWESAIYSWSSMNLVLQRSRNYGFSVRCIKD